MTITILRSFYAALTLAAAAATLADKQQQGLSIDVGPLIRKRVFQEGAQTTSTIPEDDKEMLDIVLVASVDGKFHALNRVNGHVIWSMSSLHTTTPALAALSPLVQTDHPEIDPDMHDGQEQYIIEPQSGDIYVLSDPTGPLQRLPFSMSKLVDISPYRFSDGDITRVFVGKKETSLLVIELETGRLLRTINSECPWEPPLAESGIREIDLDDLEDSNTPPATSTHIYIGRTDYRVSIHTSPSPGSNLPPPVQNLSFSVYGPNNEDLSIQSLYQRTVDDTYIQSLPDGQVVSVSTRPGAELQDRFHWRSQFKEPVVAVFDVLKTRLRPQPFALLQPSPKIEDVLGTKALAKAARSDRIPNLERAFVGLTRDSLFAMSPDHYPLVIFAEASRVYPASLGKIGSGDDKSLTADEMTKRRLWRQQCANERTSMDPRCLVGPKKLGSGLSRLTHLLDEGPKTTGAIETIMELLPNDTEKITSREVRTLPGQPLRPRLPASASSGTNSVLGMPAPGDVQALTALAIVSLGFLIALFWMKKGTPLDRFATSSMPASSVVASNSVPVATSADNEINEHVKEDLEPSADIHKSVALDSISTPQTVTFIDNSLSDVPLTPVTPMVPSTPTAVGGDGAANGDEEDSDNENGPEQPGPRRRRNRRRGKKKRAGSIAVGMEPSEDNAPTDVEKATGSSSDEKVPAKPPLAIPPTITKVASPSLVVSEDVLGFGSHGTVVYKGSLQGRAVAVKRLLRDFVTLASREVGILQDSDDHPNVIRYYYQEAHGNFLYIALELCPASLADVVERPDVHRELAAAFDPKRALLQIAAGLRHLHALKIVHRDIKPQNILISAAAKGVRGRHGGHRMLISDFGLCRRLEVDQTSFLPTMHGNAAAGTVGWRAPEILRGEVNVDEPQLSDDNASQSSRESTSTVGNGSTTSGPRPTRLTKSVDIFALGCVFYYTLTNGGHPYGDRYEREVNILKDIKGLDALDRFGEEGTEAVDLIEHMLNPEPSKRPDTNNIMLHPYFWDAGRRLTFLQDASDRFEIMCRDPRDIMLVKLETGAVPVVGHDWHQRLDRVFLDNLGKFRKYDGKNVQDLMRALRNKKHHYQDLPDNVKRHVGAMPEGFLAYFTKRFPRLFLHVYGVISDSLIRHESMFRSYFELQE